MTTIRGKVLVLYGGLSPEREVSLKSGAAVIAALATAGVDVEGLDVGRDLLDQLRVRRCDHAFIALHGRFGEDGVVQALLEWVGIPYTGSGVLASALGMDKLRCKLVLAAAGIPVPRHVQLRSVEDCAAAEAVIGLPAIVKPASQGSSLGISKVKHPGEWAAAWAEASRLDPVVLAEVCLPGPELTAAVLDGVVLPLIRLETPHEFYDYEAKYLTHSTRYHCPAGLAPETEAEIARLALAAFDAIGARGWGRVDFMLDEAGRPYVLEINTVPGMTDHSLVPMAARAAGLDFPALCLRILASSGRGEP